MNFNFQRIRLLRCQSLESSHFVSVKALIFSLNAKVNEFLFSFSHLDSNTLSKGSTYCFRIKFSKLSLQNSAWFEVFWIQKSCFKILLCLSLWVSGHSFFENLFLSKQIFAERQNLVISVGILWGCYMKILK